jgi:predicted nucleic acid-binding protein
VSVCFVDTSAIVKRYVAETGSDWVRQTLDQAVGTDVFIASITAVEFVSAVTRRTRSQSLHLADAAGAIQSFQAQTASQYMVIAVSDDVLQRAIRLAEKHGLRAYDAVQLAAATGLNELRKSLGDTPVTLISADADLNTAAAIEGLLVEDPNTHL